VVWRRFAPSRLRDKAVCAMDRSSSWLWSGHHWNQAN